ncbi:hypothetical protein SCHPADRAFT_892053 [Schizopora paradoxa]|uniref:Uncharacterized protein n=1 Tax=Schizopora paradoxa TaxID=27342 RepID=A0A0H2RMX3_9AGAM|nr:hypothetical protein SCHPADRAFT_892053 [Schizopora paradoxa]
MYLKLAAVLASSLATLAVAGSTGVGGIDSSSHLVALFDRGTPLRGMDLMNIEIIFSGSTNETMMFANDQSLEFSYTALGSVGPSDAQATKTSTVTGADVTTKVGQPSSTPTKTCSLKGKNCNAKQCKDGGGTCYYSYGSCDWENLRGEDAPVACEACDCTED